MDESDGISICGQIALRKFRKQSEDRLTPCLREPGHGGNHIYGLRIGGDVNIYAVEFLVEVKRYELKPLGHADLATGKYTDEELATVLYILDTKAKWRRL